MWGTRRQPERTPAAVTPIRKPTPEQLAAQERRLEKARAARRELVGGALTFGAIGVAILVAGYILAALPDRPAPRRDGPGDTGEPGTPVGAATTAALGRGEGAGRRAIGNPALGKRPGNVGRGTPLVASGGNQLAVFAQGCFWGVEERFRRVPGVVATAVGYAGGTTESPTYPEVSSGRTGHSEAVLVEFDPERVRYQDLLAFFWETHDPTSGNRQGPDVGTQYRSAIYTFGQEQLSAALSSRDAEQARLRDRITTDIAPAGRFWIAEEEHQQWDEKHGRLSCPAPHRAQPR
jgi:peptide-methionine (S)-S-oxide reductase